MASVNAQALAFKALHIPGNPLLLANVHDATSARIVAGLPGCKALASASYSIALSQGLKDEQLDMAANLRGLQGIAAVAAELKKPLTADIQDGYAGEGQLQECVRQLIALGVVGVNIEDSDRATAQMLDDSQAVANILAILAEAQKAGVPDFVVNARSDSFMKKGDLDEAIRRGKLYLAAGATSVYIFGPLQGHEIRECTRDEIKKMVDALDGRVNLALKLPGGPGTPPKLNKDDLTELGVARVSVGPQVYFAMQAAITAAATMVMGS